MKELTNAASTSLAGSHPDGTDERDVLLYRRKLDELKNKTSTKSEQLAAMQEKLQDTNLEKGQPDVQNSKNEDNCPVEAKQVRILENKLDKAMVKFNEALSIKKTYEDILQKLREERNAYDKQLYNLETQLKSKSIELNQMLLLSHDANISKSQSEADFKK
jgi:chromosome segregation ATPase